MPLSTAQKLAWNLACTLKVIMVLIATDSGYQVMPSDEFRRRRRSDRARVRLLRFMMASQHPHIHGAPDFLRRSFSAMIDPALRWQVEARPIICSKDAISCSSPCPWR